MNFAHETIVRLIPALGEKTMPGLNCRDIKEHNSDFKSGMYWIDPNGGSADDAFQAYCRMETLETCIKPSHESYEKQRWTKTSDTVQFFMEDIHGNKEFMYKIMPRQLDFLHLQSSRARQHVRYHCLNSEAYGTRLRLYDGEDVDTAHAVHKKFTRFVSEDECIKNSNAPDNQWHSAVFTIRTKKTHLLPIRDILLFNVGQDHQQFGIDLGEVCFS